MENIQNKYKLGVLDVQRCKKRFEPINKKWIGLTLPLHGKNRYVKEYDNHILFDILTKILLDDNTVDIYQSENVHEYIKYNLLLEQINYIHRCLRKRGI